MTPQERRKAIGAHCGEISALMGRISEHLLADWEEPAEEPTEELEWHEVLASSFADPADIAAFKKCKEKGHSDQHCFKYGDNGIGKWGDDTTMPFPMCALPPDDWQKVKDPRGKEVIVRMGDGQVICELRDTMPWKKNIKNGCGIDLNYAACQVLGVKVPLKRKCKWAWAPDEEGSSVEIVSQRLAQA